MGCQPSKSSRSVKRMASSCRDISILAEDMLVREIYRERARAKFTRAKALTIYSPKKYLQLDVGWFHPCIKCGILTSNELSYMILIRRDYEQITVNCCRVCRNKLSNKWIYSINEIHFTPRKIIRIARLR